MLTRLDRQGRIEARSFRERVAIRLAQASRRGLTHFTRDCRAIAAVEFALILPLLVLLYVGAGELSQGVMTSRRVTLLSRTLADLTSQQPTFTQATSTPMPANAMLPATLSSMLDAGTAIMAPGSLTPLTMTISAVDIVNNAAGLCCVFKVRWSYTQGGQLRPCGTNLVPADPHNLPSASTISSALTPPAVILSSSMAVLIADVSYSYTPPFSSQWLTFPGSMTRTSYMYPRTPGQVLVQAPLPVTGTRTGAICY